MSNELERLIGTFNGTRDRMNESDIVEQFNYDPEGAYIRLLERFSPVILRMIHRFTRDPDEVMEVYTTICERFRANDFQALRRFKANNELSPWLSVVVANACRDLFRKKKASSVPRSVLKQLDRREQLVFRYYFQGRLQHEDIAETIKSKHGIPCTALEVMSAIGRINELLSIKKRWHLLTAINTNRPPLSIDELSEFGYEPADREDLETALRNREQINHLTQALDELSDEDRLLVLLRFEQGMTATQIAGVLKFENHKYVYTRLRTVMYRLRKQLTGSE